MRSYISQKGPSQRQLKVGEEIRHVLSDILRKFDFHDERLVKTSITISEVRMTPDLRHARIYILTLRGENIKEVVGALNDVSSKLRQLLARQLVLKFLPQLRFVEDDAFFESVKIDSLFHSAHVKQDLIKKKE